MKCDFFARVSRHTQILRFFEKINPHEISVCGDVAIFAKKSHFANVWKSHFLRFWYTPRKPAWKLCLLTSSKPRIQFRFGVFNRHRPKHEKSIRGSDTHPQKRDVFVFAWSAQPTLPFLSWKSKKPLIRPAVRSSDSGLLTVRISHLARDEVT